MVTILMTTYACFGVCPFTLERQYTVSTNRVKVSLEEHTGKSFDEGVEVSMLSSIEIFFNVARNVYSLQEDKVAYLTSITRQTIKYCTRTISRTLQNSNRMLGNTSA